MGAQNPSPIIFGPNAKPLNIDGPGIMNSDGSITRYDGAKNYIANATFANNTTTGWSLFNTTLTGGLPTGTITLTASSLTMATTATNPLKVSESLYNLQVVGAAAVTAGQGIISTAFTIDREDLGKVLTSKIYYEVVSGAANANFSGILGSQSFAVYIYDVTAAAWLQPAGFLGMNQSALPGYMNQTFQTSVASGQQYQIAIICLQATAGAITLNFNDFTLGSLTAPIGVPSSDAVAYTPTYAGLGTVVTTGVQGVTWSRTASRMFIQGSVTVGTTTAVAATFTLPNGLLANYTSGDLVQVGRGVTNATAASSVKDLSIVAVGQSNLIYITAPEYSLGNNALSTAVTASAVISTGNTISFTLELPITGWSSNVQMSSDTDTRVISASYNTLSSTSVASLAALLFSTSMYDDAAAYTPATGTYKAPVTGKYKVGIAGLALNTGAVDFSVYVNGVSRIGRLVTINGTYRANASAEVLLNAGDTVTIVALAAATFVDTNGYFFIERLSGPSVIAATESVSARYYSSSTGISSSLTTIVFSTRGWDTHGAYNTGTGIYTIPVSGKYQVNCSISSSATLVLNNTLDIQMQQTGSSTQISEQTEYAGGAQTALDANIGDIFYGIAGDTIKVQVSNSGTSPAIVASTSKNWFSIARVGN